MLINAIKPDPADARKLTGTVQVPLFGKPVEVANFTADTTGYANQCTQLLVELSDQHVTQLLKASARYCQATREALGEEREPFEHERAVLPLIDPVRLRIPINEHYDRYSELVIDGGAPDRPAIDLLLTCDWEEEHQMQWVVRDEVVQYVAEDYYEPFEDFTDAGHRSGNYAQPRTAHIHEINPDTPVDQLEGRAHFPLFGNDMVVTGAFRLDFADQCAQILANLSEGRVAELCQATLRFYADSVEQPGQTPDSFAQARDVLRLLTPQTLLIGADTSLAPLADVVLTCAWDDTQRLQWMFCEEEVWYVGADNQIDPFDTATTDEYKHRNYTEQ